MCNCVKEIKEKLQNELAIKKLEYSNLEINQVTCDSESWIFTDNGIKTGLSVPFVVHHQPVRRKTKTVVNSIATYCPFCGERYIKENKENGGNKNE